MQYDTTLSGKIGYKNWARLVSNHHCLSTYTGLSQLSQLHDLKNWVGSPWMTHIHVIDKTTTNMLQGQTISTGVLTANVKQIKHTKYVKKTTIWWKKMDQWLQDEKRCNIIISHRWNIQMSSIFLSLYPDTHTSSCLTVTILQTVNCCILQ